MADLEEDREMVLSFLRDVLYPVNSRKCIQSDFSNLLSWTDRIQEIASDTNEKLFARWISEFPKIKEFSLPVTAHSLKNARRLALQLLLRNGQLSTNFLQVVLDKYREIELNGTEHETGRSALSLDMGEIISKETDIEMKNYLFLLQWLSFHHSEPTPISRYYIRELATAKLIKRDLKTLMDIELEKKLTKILPSDVSCSYAWETLWMLLIVDFDHSSETDPLNNKICEVILSSCEGVTNDLSPPFRCNGWLLSEISEAYFRVASTYISELLLIWRSSALFVEDSGHNENSVYKTRCLMDDVKNRLLSLHSRPRVRLLIQPLLLDFVKVLKENYLFSEVGFIEGLYGD